MLAMTAHLIPRRHPAGRVVATLLLAAVLGGCAAALPSNSAALSTGQPSPSDSPSPAATAPPTPVVPATPVATATPVRTPEVVAVAPTPRPMPTPTPNTDCGALALTPELLAGAFLETEPLPAGSGAAVEVIAGRTTEPPLEEFMRSRDFLANGPEWTGRWEGLGPVLVPGGADGVRLDTGAPTSPCALQVIVERTGQGANGQGVGAGPIRLRYGDGTEIVLGPERCFWRGFSGPGLGSVTCHGAREPEWSHLLVWVRFSFREADVTTPG
jgi:hypothetical protein